MTNIEIERKFLVVDDSYQLLAINHYTIVQGYICRDAERTIRIRTKTHADGHSQAFLTIKAKPQDGLLSRFEWENEISIPDAQALLQLCQGNIIDKTRWIVPAKEDGLIWEIDQFHSTKKGLTLAEIELTAENQSFELPPFIGEEVTGQAQYYNSNM